MYQEIFELYLSCFPTYPVTKELFHTLLKPEKAHIIQKHIQGKLVAFSLIHGSSISLLCVAEEYRKQGIGSLLLDESERYICESGANHIILGRGKHYLLQGVPTNQEEVVQFFINRGYSSTWTSTNMRLDLKNFSANKLDIPIAPENIEYRFAEAKDMPSLFDAIQDAKSAWKNVFETCTDPIYIALNGDKVIGFEVLSPAGGRFVADGEKVGCVGCVGVVVAEREKGIGRQMVVNGIEWLKSQGCTAIELRYVEIVNWYRKIGFQATQLQWMGEKEIK